MNIFKVFTIYQLYFLIVVLTGFISEVQSGRNRFSELDPTRPFVKCWELENPKLDFVASDNGNIIISENDGNISLLNTNNKSYLWRTAIGNKINSEPLIHEDKILLLSKKNNETITDKIEIEIRQIALSTGITNWILPIRQIGNLHFFKNEGTETVILISENLEIYSLDITEGKILWSISLSDKLKAFTKEDETVQILTARNEFIQIRTSDGSIRNRKKLSTNNISAILFYKDTFFIGNRNGTLYKTTDTSEVENKLFRAGGEISMISPYGENLLITSYDNFLYLYSDKEQESLWKKRLPGRVSLKPQIVGSTVLVTTVAEPEIYLLNLTDGNQINRISLGSEHIIRDIQTDDKGILVLTNKGLYKFGTKKCGV